MPRFLKLSIASLLLAVGIVAVTQGQVPNPRIEPTPAEAFGGGGNVVKPSLPEKWASDPGENPFWGKRTSPNDPPQMGMSPDSSNIRSIRRVIPRTRTFTEYVEQEVSAEEQKSAAEYLAAVQKVRSAADDSARTTARNELTALLDKVFQADLDRREKEVADAEGRIRKLREQLEKRKAAKQQIIDLRVQTVVNEATGLDFSLPFESSPLQRTFGGGSIHYPDPQPVAPIAAPPTYEAPKAAPANPESGPAPNPDNKPADEKPERFSS